MKSANFASKVRSVHHFIDFFYSFILLCNVKTYIIYLSWCLPGIGGQRCSIDRIQSYRYVIKARRTKIARTGHHQGHSPTRCWLQLSIASPWLGHTICLHRHRFAQLCRVETFRRHKCMFIRHFIALTFFMHLFPFT